MSHDSVPPRIGAALALASDTRVLRLGRRTIQESGAVFQSCFPARSAIVIADANTFTAAGRQVVDVLQADAVQAGEPFVFDDPDLHACSNQVEKLQQRLQISDAVPVAVGSGTINDLTKLAAHRCDRPYMAVATAASMDGYTAFGASITHEGSKQTFFCPAPLAVIADLDVIFRAPGELNAAGYADLVAKTTAGADWIIADALDCEAIEPTAWAMVQEPLRDWVGNPSAIRRGESGALAGLIEGLLMTGFAMQRTKSSRPASGAEHQFSHLWDMQNLRHHGRIPYHGYKVAVGTLASTLLYEQLMSRPIEQLDVNRACAEWPDLGVVDQDVLRGHELPQVRAVALQETRAKYVERDQLARRMARLKSCSPDLRRRLQAQLIPAGELRQMLADAGAPDEPGGIGIDRERLRRSYYQAQQIRRRYTVLDLAVQTGLMDGCLELLFAPKGGWSSILGD